MGRTPADRSCDLDDVIVRPVDAPSRASKSDEKDAFLSLSQTLAQAPGTAPQRLVEVAMRLTGADSAGISLADTDDGQEVFRWVAVAGELSPHLNGTMPRYSSPCGTAVDRRTTLVMRDPARHFEYARHIDPPIHWALLVPWGRAGKLIGTLWVLTHDESKSFCADDARTVEALTTFSTSILDAVGSRGARARP
jgi:GAF domain-containing protein